MKQKEIKLNLYFQFRCSVAACVRSSNENGQLSCCFFRRPSLLFVLISYTERGRETMERD